jgi:hypothetical protein
MTRPRPTRGKNSFRKAPKTGESEAPSPFRLELEQKWRDACLRDGAGDRPQVPGDHSM